jgi:hypothetical protein
MFLALGPPFVPIFESHVLAPGENPGVDALFFAKDAALELSSCKEMQAPTSSQKKENR